MVRSALLLVMGLIALTPVQSQHPWLAAYQNVCEDWEDETAAAAYLSFCREAPVTEVSADEAWGFRAAAELIYANHGWNPIEQWTTFVEWRDTLEAAIARSPDSPTLRLVRLGVQGNAPKFLGYFREIEADKVRCEQAVAEGVWRAHPTFEQFVLKTLAEL